MSRLSDMDVPICCTSCGRQLKKRLSQLHNGSTHRCPCGQRITISGTGATDYKRGLDKLDRELKKLKRLGRRL